MDVIAFPGKEADSKRMILDSSAIVAMHLKEPGYERLFEKVGRAELAVAAVSGLPLLHTGDDFSRTGIAAA